MSTAKRSPADVCLNRSTTMLNFNPRDALPVYDDLHQLQVTLEHRAWVCPFCEQSTEYWLLNGSVILGCGLASMFANGRQSDCCSRWLCQDAQKAFHGVSS